MELLFSFILSVAAGVTSNYICKWLDAMMTERFNRQWVRDYPKTKLNYKRSPFGIEGYRRGFLLHLVNP